MTYKINGHLHKYLISLCEFQKNFPLPSFSEKKRFVRTNIVITSYFNKNIDYYCLTQHTR